MRSLADQGDGRSEKRTVSRRLRAALAPVLTYPNAPPTPPVRHDADSSEMGTSRFSAHDVHAIGILDIRLFNTDRHAGNILVRRPTAGLALGGGDAATPALDRLGGGRLELVPIDHGFCLPEALEPLFLEWLHWPQAALPFSDAEKSYIAALDADADADLLRRELPSLHIGCLRVLHVGTLLLKKAASAGLCLAEIGAVVSRPLVGMDEEPSELEKLCWAARGAALAKEAGREGCASTDGGCDAGDAGCDAISPAELTRAFTVPLPSRPLPKRLRRIRHGLHALPDRRQGPGDQVGGPVRAATQAEHHAGPHVKRGAVLLEVPAGAAGNDVSRGSGWWGGEWGTGGEPSPRPTHAQPRTPPAKPARTAPAPPPWPP